MLFTRTVTHVSRVTHKTTTAPTACGVPSDLLATLQLLALIIGYGFSIVGGSLFALGVFCLADAGPNPWIEEPFRWSGYWLLPAWLLLRFPAGLFPFGRRMFKWQ